MKRILSMVTALALLLSMQTRVFAEQLPTGDITTVDSYEALQEAVAAANDGDTIAIAQTIVLEVGEFATEKEITLTRADGFTGSPLLILQDGTVVTGFKFYDTDKDYGPITIQLCTEAGVAIQDCSFDGGKVSTYTNSRCFIDISGAFDSDGAPNRVDIQDCTFLDSGRCAVVTRSHTDVVISDCVFKGNQGRAISNSGHLIITNSLITENTTDAGGGGIFSSGELVISDCKIFGNTALSPDFGSDILSLGKISITDAMQDEGGYYEVTTGEKLNLPLIKSEAPAKLTYMTDEAAEDYFKPQQPTPPDNGNDDEGGEGIDWTPILPPQNDEEDWTPIFPPQDNEEDWTPVFPPQDNEEDNDDYRPVIRPKDDGDEYTSEPEQAPTSILVCGNAKLDTTRTVALAGYGDGQLHEEDGLTRAQLAVIIYRQLEDSSISTEDGISPFRDVAPDAWYARPVSTLHSAGAVNGIGDNLYSPDTLVTWAQALTVLCRFVGPQEYELQNICYEGWATQAVETAACLEWIADSADFSPVEIISRGEFVYLVNSIFEQYR